MQITKQYRKEKTSDKTSERGELLKFFKETLNQSREKSGYKNLTFPRVAHLLQGIPTKDLYFLQSSMRSRDLDAACKLFYWSLRPKEDEIVNG